MTEAEEAELKRLILSIADAIPAVDRMRNSDGQYVLAVSAYTWLPRLRQLESEIKKENRHARILS